MAKLLADQARDRDSRALGYFGMHLLASFQDTTIELGNETTQTGIKSRGLLCQAQAAGNYIITIHN